MSPIPARVTAFDDLADTARTGGPGLARATLKVQTELFARHPDNGTDDFLQLALNLLPMVDEATARDIALKLGPLPQTPRSVLEALFARGGGVAETVIETAPALDMHLRHAAADHDDPRLPARLADRPDLDTEEQLHLAGRGETSVLRALARNAAITLGRAAAAALISAARHDEVLAQAMLVRVDLDTVALTPLYRFANTSQRARIRSDIDQRIIERNLNLPRREASEAEQARLIEASLGGMPALIADLALVTGRDGDFVTAAARDASREIVALSLVSLGLIPEDVTRILLRTGDALACNSRALHALVGIIRTTSRATAEMIIGASWPRQALTTSVQHVPVMAPGGNTSRTGQGAIRKPGTRQIIDQVRLKS